MAKKKEVPPVEEEKKEVEMVPVLLPNTCIGHWVPKTKD